MSFWYLATPYSKYSAGLQAAYEEALANAGLLIAAKIPVFSPIAHTHPIAIKCGINPLDHSVWLPADAPIMKSACGIVVCMLDGWEVSVGMDWEIGMFAKAGKPIVYMDPGVVPDDLIRWRDV